MKKYIIYIIMILLTSFACAKEYKVPKEILSKKTIKLTKGWDFYKGRFVAPSAVNDETPDCTVDAPWVWTDFYSDGLGCGTFRLRLTDLEPNTTYSMFLFDSVGTSYNLYINEWLIQIVGSPNMDCKKSKGDQSMELVYIASNDEGVLDIVLQVSNNFHRKGGLWGLIRFGSVDKMQDFFLKELNKRYAYIGMLVFVIIFHFLFFLMRREDKASLYLTLFTIVFSIRIAVQGFSLIKFYAPSFPYSITLKLEYMALYFLPLFYALYLRNLYGKESFKHKMDVHIVIINLILSILAWVCPINIVNRLVPLMELTLIVSAIILVYCQFKIGKQNKKSHNSLIMGCATGVVALFAFHDIFVLNYVPIFLQNTNLLPYSMLIFVGAQSLITALNRDLALKSVQKMSADLEEINDIYYKFVPREFLSLLSKENITDVVLDEKKRKKLTLLSADIRNFTTISEQLKEDEVFEVLNKYLSTIGPIIRDNGGFIEKYLGDGIVVLFPDDGKKAIRCAIEMQQATGKLCQEFNQRLGQDFRIGIGIHYGSVVLMTVGEQDRMTGLTISSAVNTVLQLEGLTKQYLKPILISKSYLNYANFGDEYNFVKVDTIQLKDENAMEDIFTIETYE